MTDYRCNDCKDTRRVVIWDADDTTPEEPILFTGCWTCNEDDRAAWDDSRCPECGGSFNYPHCTTDGCALSAGKE